MNQTASSIQPEIPNIIPNADSTSEQNQNYQEEISKLLLAVDKFSKTGQVEDSEVSFAKEKILPNLGYSKEQIDQLDPSGVMVKLQEEAVKKGLESNDKDNRQNQKNAEDNNIKSAQDQKKEIEISQKPPEKTNQNNEASLTKEVMDMTDNLSGEIDKEIKRQLAEKKSLEHAQQKIDNVIAEQEKLNIPYATKEEKNLAPTIGLFHTKTEHDKEVSKPIEQKTYPPPNSEIINNSTTPTDPLTASIEFALNSIKEGDPVGKDWVLRKILTTSFGNKKSPFYELVNKSGASWTLSPEEMRDVIRSNIFSDNKTAIKEIKGEKPEPLHELELKKVSENEQIEERENYTEPKDTKEKKQEEEKKAEKTSETNSKPVKFNQKQIDFLNKIHADSNLWSGFTSFNPDLWESFSNLYEQGRLINIGIDAHPLFDKLSNNEYFSLIEIKKGDNFSNLLSEAGYNLTWTNEDAEVFAVHIIANHKLLSDSAHKMEVSGLTKVDLPSPKKAIELAAATKNGDSKSLHKLVEALNFLPVGSKFKIIKPNQLVNLKKYFDL